MSWEYIKAEDFCDSVRDGTHDTPKPTIDGHKLVTSKHIKNGQIDPTEAYCISEEDYQAINIRSLVEQWDVLMSMIGTVGESAVVKQVPDFAIKNVALFKCGKSEIKGKWLNYYLRSPEARARMSGNMKGSSQQFLSLKQLRALMIPVCDQSIMGKIVAILSTYDDLIENNRKQIKLLEEAAQRLYKEWFVDLRFPGYEHTKIVDGVPEGWEKRLLGDVVEVKYGKDHKSIPDGLVPVYGSGGFMRKCNQVLHNGESVLIPRKGSLNNIIYVDEAFWTVDTMFYTKMKLPDIGIFVYFFIKSFDMYSMNIGAAVPSMTTNILNALDIIIPNNDVLGQFQSVSKRFFNKIALLHKQIGTATQARDRLLPKLMSGEVEI